MKEMEWRTKDKSDWGPGPWQDEPDKVQYTDEDTGLPCLIVRNDSGALCGYVGVPASHPFFGKDYNEVKVDVHGGLSFSDFCADTEDPSRYICHLVEPGEPDKVWWLGYDCAHSRDVSPAYESSASLVLDGYYKDIDYVKDQNRHLAQQLIEKHGTGIEE